jgi:hypothetical protein
MEWADHMTRWGWRIYKYQNLAWKTEGKRNVGDLASYGRIAFKLILKIEDRKARLGLIGLWSRIGGCLL